MTFAGLTVFFLSLGSTAIYTYTPELYPPEIRATATVDRLCLGTSGCRDHAFSLRTFLCHPRQITIISDHRPVLIAAVIVVLCCGPSTRGRPLQETQLGAAREPLSG